MRRMTLPLLTGLPILCLASAVVWTQANTLDPRPQAASASALPLPKYHHIHLNSANPNRSLDWYAKYWPAGKKTTVAGFPAFEGGNGLSLLYTKVDKQPPGAFDRTLHRSVPQS